MAHSLMQRGPAVSSSTACSNHGFRRAAPLVGAPSCRPAPVLHGRAGRRPAAASGESAGAAPAPDLDADAEALARKGWDPQGVFANAKPLAAPGQDLFAAREARRAAAAATAAAGAAPASASSHPAVATPAAPSSAQAPQPTQQAQEQAPPKPPPSPEPSPAPATAAPTSVSTNPVVTPVAPREWARPLQGFSPQVAAAGGVAGAQDDPVAGYSRAAFEALLQSSFMGVDLDTPGLRVLHMDPPVLMIDGFVPVDMCEAIMKQAAATGRLATSKVGAGNAGAAVGGENAYDSRRTSSSMLLDPKILGAYTGLRNLAARFHEMARTLMAPAGPNWGKTGVMPAAKQYCFESPQVARYEGGQHFLAHEDAFPSRLARYNGFNRHATLLIYLNDVPQGGGTKFDHLGLEVRPKQGRALLFFPSFADGRHDERTLHTATDAVDLKWVMQQWIARGWSEPTAAAVPTLGAASAVAGPAAAARAPAPATAAAATSAAQPAVVKTFSIPVDAAKKAASRDGKDGAKGKKGGKKGFGK